MASLTLSDGTRSLDFIGTPPIGVFLVEFDAPITTKEETYSESADGEGRQRLRSKPSNPTGGMVIRIAATSEAVFWDRIDDLQELIESVHRERGTLRYAPPRNGEPVTFDIESIHISGLPQNGVELNNLNVEGKIEFECRPYGRLDPVTIFSGVTFAGPIAHYDIAGVPGHVDAWGELTLTDASTQQRQHLEVGLAHDFQTAEPNKIALPDLVLTGTGGSSTTRSGSISTNVARATAYPTATVVCKTAGQTHLGKKKIRARIYPSATNLYVRLAWAVGSAPLTRERWVTVPAAGGWFDVELGVIDIAAVASGTHSWVMQVETYAETGSPTVDVDLLEIVPADGYLRARAVMSESASVLSEYDDFSQAAGALVGKTAPVGGTWAGGGDAVDFAVHADDYLTRSELSDVALVGRFANLGTSYTNVGGSMTVQTTAFANLSQGFMVRRVDASNYFRALILSTDLGIASWSVDKVVAGARTVLGSGSIGSALALRNLTLVVDTAGGWVFTIDDVEHSGFDGALATGGALASGTINIYDENTSAIGSATRKYDNYRVWIPTTDVVLHSTRAAKLLHNDAIRQSSDGTSYGRMPGVDGQHLVIPPATRNLKKSRLVIKSRRFDVDSGLPDSGTADNLTGTLVVTPRILLLGEPGGS